MVRSISKLFYALILTAATAGIAHAGTLQNWSYSLLYQPWFTPVSLDGNSVTFAYTPSSPTISDGNFWIDKELFAFKAQPHFTLTGKMNFEITGTYGGNMDLTNLGGELGSLIPHCPDYCGPYDSDQLALTANATLTANNGKFDFKFDALPASGSYSQLFLATGLMIVANGGGPISLQTVTVGAETAQTSPLPELPPAVMLALGLGLMGIVVRRKSESRK